MFCAYESDVPILDSEATSATAGVSEEDSAQYEQYADTKSVLVLDDDSCFQELIKTLLESQGYDVWPARTAAEASAFLAAREPDLMIVDYRLPGMDGISWISQTRESGNTTPIIFVSGTWCDAKTFNWLRNILHVSLIFQKPIEPQLFLHALEDVLPSPAAKEASAAASAAQPTSPSTAEYADLLENGNFDESLAKLDALIESSAGNPIIVHELTQIRRKVRTQKAMHTARVAFIAQIPAIWEDLVDKAWAAHQKQDDHLLLSPAIEAAHKLRGTSGSYGLTHIAEIAGQIETFLKSIDPSCTPEDTGVFWLEIANLLERGEEIVELLARFDSVEKKRAERSISLLLVSGNAQYRKLLSESVLHKMDVHVVNSAAGAVAKAKSIPLDAAVIDLSLNVPGLTSSLTAYLRAVRNCEQLPFIFIANPRQYSSISELIYSGCSALLEPPVTDEALDDAIQCLRGAFKSREKRILCVDDDQLLTSLLCTVLNEAGFDVKPLHEPIHILEALESFQPELILLDVMMPGLSGYEVCRMLRSHKEWNHIPVVFLTVKNEADCRAAAFKAGGNDFLAKPVVTTELIARVKAQLAMAEKEGHHDTDELSGVLQPQPFKKQAARALEKCNKDNIPASLGVIEIEHYDQLDDRYGGHSKQQVLAELGYLLSIRFRTTDLRGMLKDGTFAIIFPGESSTTTKGALALLQEEIAQSSFAGASGDPFYVAVKTGVADAGKDGLTFDSLAKCAIQRAANSRSMQQSRITSSLPRLPIS